MMNKKIRRRYIGFVLLTALFYVLYYLGLYLPIGIFTFVNRAKYFYHYEGIKVGLGAIMTIALLILFSRKEHPKIKGIWVYLIIFLLSFFLDSIMEDMIYISFYLLIGKVISMIINPFLKYFKGIAKTYRDGGINAGIFKETIKENVSEE